MNKYKIGDIIVSEKNHYVIVADFLYKMDLYQIMTFSERNNHIPYYLERPYVEDRYKLVSKA